MAETVSTIDNLRLFASDNTKIICVLNELLEKVEIDKVELTSEDRRLLNEFIALRPS